MSFSIMQLVKLGGINLEDFFIMPEQSKSNLTSYICVPAQLRKLVMAS